MRILVTGGAGFIGSNFIRFWTERHPDDQVINVDSMTYAANAMSLEAFDALDNYVFERADISHGNAMDLVFANHRPDVVVNFAAETHVDRSIVDRSTFVRTNVVGTQVLLDMALHYGCRRFHHISTDEVFGAIAPEESRVFEETTPYAPRNPYSASKAGADHLVKSYGETFGLPVTVTNCSNNYGPWQSIDKLIPLAITNLLSGKSVPVYGTGSQSRDWLHVSDHCRAIEAVLQDGTEGEAYCVGGANAKTTNLELINLLCRMTNRDPGSSVEFVADRPGHDFRYAVDSGKISRRLGWEPHVDLIAGLERTVEWYDLNRSWWEKSTGDKIQLKI